MLFDTILNIPRMFEPKNNNNHSDNLIMQFIRVSRIHHLTRRKGIIPQGLIQLSS